MEIIIGQKFEKTCDLVRKFIGLPFYVFCSKLSQNRIAIIYSEVIIASAALLFPEILRETSKGKSMKCFSV